LRISFLIWVNIPHIIVLKHELTRFSGFSVIFARVSDGIGQRTTLIIAWLLFGLFSLGAGLSRTLNQAIGFRVLQGIGASGLYTMAFVFGTSLTPSNLFGLFSGILGIVITIGAVIGMCFYNSYPIRH
jgi:MFS family permease